MDTQRSRSRVALVAFLLLAVAMAAQDSTGGADIRADDIIRKVTIASEQRMARLRSYRSTRVYEVDYKGFGGDRHAKMMVNINYQGGQKSFTVVKEEGSKLLLNRVIRKAIESEQDATNDDMRRRSALTEANYTFEFVGSEAGEQPMFVLQVKPKRKDKYLYDGKVWIDASDYAVARIEAQPAKNPSFWITGATIEHRNMNVRGFWLPSSNRSTSKVRLGGRALLTIDYGKYETLVAE